jgi:hypothetical protein
MGSNEPKNLAEDLVKRSFWLEKKDFDIHFLIINSERTPFFTLCFCENTNLKEKIRHVLSV